MCSNNRTKHEDNRNEAMAASGEERILAKLGQIESRIEERFAKIDQRLDGIDQRLDSELKKINVRMDGIDQQLDKLDAKMDKSHRMLAAISLRVSDHKERITKLEMAARDMMTTRRHGTAPRNDRTLRIGRSVRPRIRVTAARRRKKSCGAFYAL